ncbi:MAG: 2-oxoglutarate dehydrogenase E1 component [Chlorobi bacterium]|nr:2-oxoglutarate dehydrogenase E1 component [Chlorobiota bacterium]
MDNFSFLSNSDPSSIEKLYHDYINDKNSVDESWYKFFEGFEFARTNFTAETIGTKLFDKEFKVINLIKAYRQRGHLFTETNPVRTRRKYFPTLHHKNFDLDDKDLETVFQAGQEIGIGPAKLKDIIAHLKTTYCRTIGAEYIDIRKPEMVTWFQNKMEKSKNLPEFSAEEKKHIYYHLKIAVGFEKFIHKKFVGQKRFSLEGAESLIPSLDAIIEKGAEMGIDEFIIGMSHRGRLNVMANILNKPYENIFEEYNGKEYEGEIIMGDVKYHLGYGNEIVTDKGKKVRVNLAPNPSHLEAIGPVVQGITRAKIDHKYKNDYKKVAPIIIHGDAAIASQGVVYEVIQMSQLEGYKTGGTIHLVINNQVGFTTNYLDARSSTYCTDIGKVTRSPVFHVNGDDVEALIYVIKMAMEYRQKFHNDVFIDILSYRKHGHNEGDEPRFTQPTLYKAISTHPNPRDIYAKKLIENGIYTNEEIKTLEKTFDNLLNEKFTISQKIDTVQIKQFLIEDWKDYKYPFQEDFYKKTNTSYSKKELIDIFNKINTFPDDKKIFRKIQKLANDHKKMLTENRLDWASCELLAYGSLLKEGFPIRISGQDSQRGTFSHRHAALVIEDTDDKYFPLKHISEKQAPFNVYNSPLSEYGVLGFEYGYALASPESLTIWEAQFGDFANVAQVIIDQYISSAEEKWGLMNGLVLYLPHGYEGQGPEHSSARMERFLTLCANNNMQVLNITSPANLFHALRRQLKRNFQIPMVIFTPKSLLRHPQCVSTIEDLSNGSFHEIIDDTNADPSVVNQMVITSGKIYYDLIAKKEELKAKEVAIIRIEQLYPFPEVEIEKIIKKYKNVIRYVWAQDEPKNMGAWNFVKNKLPNLEIEPVTRPESGAPAGGLHELHLLRLKKIMNKIFKKCDCEWANTYCDMQCVGNELVNKQTFELINKKN